MASTIFTKCLDTLNLTDLTGHYVYIAWANNELGNGYTTTFDLDKRFFAIRVSDSELVESASLYIGLWQPLGYPNKTTLCDYNFVRDLDTKFKGHQQLPINTQTMGFSAWYYEGTYRRVYFCFQGRVNWNVTIEYLTNYISYYDIDTGKFATPVDIGVSIATFVDPHLMAFPFVDSTGYVHILHEKGKTGTAWDANTQHNSEIVHKKATATESITSFTTVAEITTTGRAYPHIWEMTNGNFHCTWRAGGYDSIYTAYSADDGATFRNMSGTLNNDTEIVRLNDVLSNGYAYHTQLSGPKEHGMNIVIQAYDYGAAPPHSVDDLYFLHSDDGITWENVNSWKETGSGEFSKNVVSSGFITCAELNTNCKIPAQTGNPYKWNPRCGAVTKDGMPIVHYALETFVGDQRIDNTYIAYWSGSSWTQKEITTDWWPEEILGRSYGSVAKSHNIITYDDATWDVIISYIPDGMGLTTEDNHVLSSGNMIGEIEGSKQNVYTGARYMVVENDYSAGIPWNATTHIPGYVYMHLGLPQSDPQWAGASFGDGLGSLTSSNRVKMVKLALKVMRTFDSGTTWQQVADIKSDKAFGLSRAGSSNAHFLDDEKFFFFVGDSSSTDGTYPDATNIKMIYEDLKLKDIS